MGTQDVTEALAVVATPEEAARFKNHWVAVDAAGRVRVHAKTAAGVLKAIAEAGVKRAEVTLLFWQPGALIG